MSTLWVQVHGNGAKMNDEQLRTLARNGSIEPIRVLIELDRKGLLSRGREFVIPNDKACRLARAKARWNRKATDLWTDYAAFRWIDNIGDRLIGGSGGDVALKASE